jgi:hypothetical protein
MSEFMFWWTVVTFFMLFIPIGAVSIVAFSVNDRLDRLEHDFKVLHREYRRLVGLVEEDLFFDSEYYRENIKTKKGASDETRNKEGY